MPTGVDLVSRLKMAAKELHELGYLVMSHTVAEAAVVIEEADRKHEDNEQRAARRIEGFYP